MKSLIPITRSDIIQPFALGSSGDRNQPEWMIGLAGIRNVGFFAQVAQLDIVYGLSERLALITSSADAPGATGEATRVVFTALRLVLVSGSVLFMWQIRHPKTE